MRPLAEFVMRGRSQALLLAVPSVGTAYFYWFGAAVVGLVTLRKGIAEGALILLWALLPAAALLIWFQEFMPLACLLATAAASTVLRKTVSWRLTLLALMLGGYLLAGILMTFADGFLAHVVDIYSKIIAEIQKEIGKTNSNAAAVLAAVPVTKAFIAGFYGVMLTVTSFVACVLARWWQSLLYNPGGFQQEFHRLQLPPAATITLIALAAICVASGKGMISWAAIACIPLLICGIALVHGIIGIRHMKSHWLVVFYMFLLFVDELKLFLVMLAIVDSFVGFRQRMRKPPQPQ